LDEHLCIQWHLRFGGIPNKDKAAHTYFQSFNATRQGSCCTTLSFCHSFGGVLNLDALVPEKLPNGNEVMSSIHRILLDKHPLGKPPDPSTLLADQPGVANPVIYMKA